MREKFFRTSALLVLIILVVLLLPFAFQKTVESPAYTQTSDDALLENEEFILMAADNHLIVTSKDGKTLQITEIDPRTLPPYDQQALSSGISVKSRSALEEMLQDFS